MDEAPSTPSRAAGDTQDERLESWKKIASFLKRDVSTVQRWERREAMPVHRHLHDKQGSVYAYRNELEQWWAGRSARLAQEPPPPAGPATPAAGPRHRMLALVLGLLLLVAVAVAVAWQWLEYKEFFWSNPLAGARFSPLTDFEGGEGSATMSRDGSRVAFLSDRDGQVDVWATRVGTGTFRNLTNGRVHELVNASIRTLGFSPDGALVSIWTRQPDGSRAEDINLMAVPPDGGPLRPYLAQAAEYDWSVDGRIVYHSTAPGDPMYVRGPNEPSARHLYTAPPGVHCHFPAWSPDATLIYLVCGQPPDKWDIWRIAAQGGPLERMTTLNARVSHPVFLGPATLAFLATDADGAGPWLYGLDLHGHGLHRLTSGIERYTSLAGSADAMRLVVTVAAHRSTLWRLPLAGGMVAEQRLARVPLDSAHATMPREGPGYLLYVTTEGDSAGLWKTAHGVNTSLWSSGRERVEGAPAIAPDGKHIAFVASAAGHTQLRVMREDGTDNRGLGGGLDLRGTPAWTPDGRSLVCAVNQDGTPRLFVFPLAGGPATQLMAEYSIDPSWSPDGKFLVYSGPDVGTTFPLRAAAADGRAWPMPSLVLTRGARRVAFFRDGHTLLLLRGTLDHKDFWLVDLASGSERQLTHLARDFAVGDFDLSADDSEIVLDRVQENADLVLIDRARR